MCYFGEVGECGSDLSHVGFLHEQESHAGAEEDDAGLGVARKRFALKIFFPKCDIVVGEPVVLQGFDIFNSQKHIVVAEVRLFWREL